MFGAVSSKKRYLPTAPLWFYDFFDDAHCVEVCALYLVTGTNLCAGCNEYKTDLWKRLSRCADYILTK